MTNRSNTNKTMSRANSSRHCPVRGLIARHSTQYISTKQKINKNLSRPSRPHLSCRQCTPTGSLVVYSLHTWTPDSSSFTITQPLLYSLKSCHQININWSSYKEKSSQKIYYLLHIPNYKMVLTFLSSYSSLLLCI